MTPFVQSFFDHATSTVTHVVSAGPGTPCAIIDSVLDFDPKSGRTATHSADAVIDYVRAQGMRVAWVLETHAHADHLSAAPYLADRLDARIAIGGSIRAVQNTFANIFNTHPPAPRDGSQFDHLFAPDEVFMIGGLEARAIHVPGHTPADMAYHVGDALFVGDSLFMPDLGTARCDFPGGSASSMYHSVRRILSMPVETRLFMCHDYPPAGREARWVTTVAEQRAHNIHIRDGITEAQFVELRTRRDATLEMPTLILPAIQVNINGGRLPEPEENGLRYLKIPINAL
jgi:glyoxylase-like metal-dependent hydrolase (beta-lactamase superfamily II)